MDERIGLTLQNRFRVDAFIASGGMGAVYKVWDLQRSAHLAMKVLHSGLAQDPSVLKRFKREANALKHLSHPNIVPFYGLFEEQNYAFLLERYIDGPSLKDRMTRPLPVDEAMIYMRALCSALGYAHTQGVVHCDVKPGNVMVDWGGNVYLTDFGIARHADSATTTILSAGTAAYMAPEQILSEMVTPATDVYALGVVLFEMLTGVRPFSGEQIPRQHISAAPPDPRKLNSAISSALASVVLQALEKNPADRYPGAQAFFSALCRAVEVNESAVPERVPITGPVPPPAPQPSRSFAPPPQTGTKPSARPGPPSAPPKLPTPPPRPQRARYAWIAGGLLLLAVFMWIFLAAGDPTDARARLPGGTPADPHAPDQSPQPTTRVQGGLPQPALPQYAQPTAVQDNVVSPRDEAVQPAVPQPALPQYAQPTQTSATSDYAPVYSIPTGGLCADRTDALHPSLKALLDKYDLVYDPQASYFYYTDCIPRFGGTPLVCKMGNVIVYHDQIHPDWWIFLPGIDAFACGDVGATSLRY